MLTIDFYQRNGKITTDMVERRNGPLAEEASFLMKLKEVPMADVLVESFEEFTDPNTWQLGEVDSSTQFITGNIETSHGTHAMVLRGYRCSGRLETVILRIHGLAPFDEKNDRWGDVAITAGAEETSTWSAAWGHLKSNRIRVTFNRSFLAPAFYPRWLLSTVNKILTKLSERYDPLHEQPVFWESGRRSE